MACRSSRAHAARRRATALGLLLAVALVGCGSSENATGVHQGRGSKTFSRIVAGESGGCVIRRDDERVFCWDGNVEKVDVDVPGDITKAAFEIAEAKGAVDLSVGHQACAAMPDGRALCWPLLDYEGAVSGAVPPVAVLVLTGVTAVAVGPRHSCALSGGTVACWGFEIQGEIGGSAGRQEDPKVDSRKVEEPVVVAGIGGVQQIVVGAEVSCAIAAGDAVWCWGKPWHGVSGWKDPVELVELKGASALLVEEGRRCALLAGEVTCVITDAQVQSLCEDNVKACAARDGGGTSICAMGDPAEACPEVTPWDPSTGKLPTYTFTLPERGSFASVLRAAGGGVAVGVGPSWHPSAEQLNAFFILDPPVPCGAIDPAHVVEAFDLDDRCQIQGPPNAMRDGQSVAEAVFCSHLGTRISGNTTFLCEPGAYIEMPP